MSLYTELLNQIKTMATFSWLTDNQRKTHDQILTRWDSQRFVCLLGPPGCGKTFVSHILAREHGYVYSHDIVSVIDGSNNVLIDGEEYTRLMRDASSLKDLGRVIVVTRRAPKDIMPTSEILLTDKDVSQFQANLTRHGILGSFLKDPLSTDLGKIIRAECVARGSKNVTS